MRILVPTIIHSSQYCYLPAPVQLPVISLRGRFQIPLYSPLSLTPCPSFIGFILSGDSFSVFNVRFRSSTRRIAKMTPYPTSSQPNLLMKTREISSYASNYMTHASHGTTVGLSHVSFIVFNTNFWQQPESGINPAELSQQVCFLSCYFYPAIVMLIHP